MNYLNSLEPIKLFERDSRSENGVVRTIYMYYPAEAVW